MIRYALLLAFLIAPISYAQQDDWLVLKGKIRVASEPLSDPAPDGKPVAYLSISGGAAKSIYDGMSGRKTTQNACGEKGLTSRAAGNVVCFRKNSTYSCEFGIRLTDGETRVGKTC